MLQDFKMRCPVHEIEMKLSSVKDKKKNRLQLSTHYAHFPYVSSVRKCPFARGKKSAKIWIEESYSERGRIVAGF